MQRHSDSKRYISPSQRTGSTGRSTQWSVCISGWIYTVCPALYHTVHPGSVAYIMPAAMLSDSERAAVRRTSKLSHHNEWDEMRGVRSQPAEA